MARFNVIALVVIITITFLVGSQMCEAVGGGAYRKPPFNGSIFGKRNAEGGSVGGGGGGQIDGKGITSLGALCEIAVETCSSLYLESR